jgi:DNA-binding MarR family transcriptional regulator
MTTPASKTIARDCLASRLRLLNRLVTGIYDTALRPHGLRISQMNLLVAVSARGKMRGSELCRLLRLEKSTLSRDVERLVERGWIVRSPALEVTRAGEQLLTACLPAWRGAQREARKLLTPSVADGTMQVVQELWLRDDPVG